MSWKLTIHLCDEMPAEEEIFETRADALNFAKRIHREGYVKDDTFYPIGSLRKAVAEETDEVPTERLPGHGL
jgi:hypothetical protein